MIGEAEPPPYDLLDSRFRGNDQNRESCIGYHDVFMNEIFFCIFSGVVCDELAASVQFVFIDNESFETDGAAGVDFIGADGLSSI